MWVKGQSGNPSGRPKVLVTVRNAAREHTAKAIATLAEVMEDRKAPSAARVAAASTLLDRGWGRAPQHVTVEKSPLDELDAATLAALSAALAGAEGIVADGGAGDTRH